MGCGSRWAAAPVSVACACWTAGVTRMATTMRRMGHTFSIARCLSSGRRLVLVDCGCLLFIAWKCAPTVHKIFKIIKIIYFIYNAETLQEVTRISRVNSADHHQALAASTLRQAAAASQLRLLQREGAIRLRIIQAVGGSLDMSARISGAAFVRHSITSARALTCP